MLKLWCEWGVSLFSKYLIIIDNLIQTGLDKVRPRYTCQHTHTTHNSFICSEEGLFLKTLALKLLMVASLHHQLS